MTKISDTAAQASIGASTRELRLPVVRSEAARLPKRPSVTGSVISAIWPTCADEGRPRCRSSLPTPQAALGVRRHDHLERQCRDHRTAGVVQLSRPG